jgi:hypothetical protein
LALVPTGDEAPSKPAGLNTVNEKLKEINNPEKTPEERGAVLESHDVPVKTEPQPRDDDRGDDDK